jgi:predicted PhzF superfamily epimerase YddE/YHI9
LAPKRDKNASKSSRTIRAFPKFVYLFHPETLECRTWDNRGKVEDAATGSAAGPLCAYLVKNGFRQAGEVIRLHQGRYVNRPSIIEGWVSPNGEVSIRGDVSFFAMGEIY